MINKESGVSNIKNPIAACIDLGSSYFRLLVVDRSRMGGPSELTPLLEERIYIGWGRCLQEDGIITPGEAENALRALRRLVEDSAGAGCDSPVIVATNTLRNAVNAKQTTAMLEHGISLPVEILSQDEEAALSFAGVSSGTGGGHSSIVIDAGGTSTEIVWGVDGTIKGSAGIQLGTHGVRSRMPRGNLRRFSFRSCRDPVRNTADFIREQLDHFKGSQDFAGGKLSFLPPGGERPKIIFTGGTAVSTGILARFMAGSRSVMCESTVMTTRGFDLVRRRVRYAFESGRERFFPLEAERRDLLLPGLALMKGVLDLILADTFHVVARDLRWAVVTRENGRIDTR
ncbi:MAG: hypothetical protein KOO63_16925 [Bacteroidales bacterium]|nr:hypothetical protein [Candidatus Latescibacterota bacterium]